MGLSYYVLDTETTGLVHSKHEVTEISIIRCSDRNQLYKKIKCRYPERASLDALRITRKTMSDLLEGDEKEYVVDLCNKFFELDGGNANSRVIVAHNASFDMRFVHSLWDEVNSIFPANMWLDTVSLVKEYAKKQNIVKPKVNLEASCAMLGITKVAQFHNAKGDTRNTYMLHKELINTIDPLKFIKTIPHKIESNGDLLSDIDNDLLNEMID